MFISSVATATFPYQYSQNEICAWYLNHRPEGIEESWVRAIFAGTCVHQRSFVVPLDDVVSPMDFGVRNSRFRELATPVLTPLIHEALKSAGLTSQDVGALATITSSGFLTPSLDSDLIHATGLPAATRRMPIVGLGCAAGVSGLAHAAAWAKGYGVETLVFASAEFQSLTYLPNDNRRVNVIGAGLFADGAAVVVCRRNAKTGWKIVDSATHMLPKSSYLMGWDICAEGFGLVLSEDVPSAIAKMAPAPLTEFLKRSSLTQTQVNHWLLHPGGPKILTELAEATGLHGDPIDAAFKGLAEHGNMSSCSVLYRLHDFLAQPAKSGETTMLVSFGPGFSMEMVLLQYIG